MKLTFWAVAVVLLLALPAAWASSGITYGNGSITQVGASMSCSVGFSPSAPNGSILWFFWATIGAPGTITSVLDSASQSLTALTSNIYSSSTTHSYAYYETVTNNGGGGATASWTNSRTGLCIALYYTVTGGTASVSATNYNSTTGTGTAPSLSLNIDDANDFVVGSIMTDNTSTTITTGNSRETQTTGAVGYVRGSAGDNTSASSGASVTIGSSATPTDWVEIVGEIRFTPSSSAPSNLPLLGVGE